MHASKSGTHARSSSCSKQLEHPREDGSGGTDAISAEGELVGSISATDESAPPSHSSSAEGVEVGRGWCSPTQATGRGLGN